MYNTKHTILIIQITLVVTMLILAPLLTNTSTMSVWPWRATWWRAAHPSYCNNQQTINKIIRLLTVYLYWTNKFRFYKWFLCYTSTCIIDNIAQVNKMFSKNSWNIKMVAKYISKRTKWLRMAVCISVIIISTCNYTVEWQLKIYF